MLKFLVFSDLHYKKMMYASSVRDLQTIMDRASDEKVDFVVHAGDLCNDYLGSPEIMKTFLENDKDIPVYGVFGNHELETDNNSVQVVREKLSNQKVNFGDQEDGYWYADIGAYRLIGLDTNYSYSDALQGWEHNRTASWGAPAGNRFSDSLGPKQLQWLDEVLADAAAQHLKVITVSHAGLAGTWTGTMHSGQKTVVKASPDAEKVRGLFEKYAGTVILSINGHYHTDHFIVQDGIAYLDVNTVQNGFWASRENHHYAPEHTFAFTDYDGDGNEKETRSIPFNALSQSKNTWFFDRPLSAVITIGDDGTLTVEGSKTNWYYGVEPDGADDGMKPEIPDRKVKLW